MTIFGARWEALTLEDVRAFLDDAGPEPLSWEAKGTELSRGEVRVQVCGFANSHDGGYLILGAAETGAGWNLAGVVFPEDPPIWISHVVGDGAVSPYPDGLDTRAWQVTNDRHLAVVKIPPVATPPANTGGRVYERVSGRTIPVREPLRLAALFERGDQARRAAEGRSLRAASSAMQRGPSRPHFSGDHIQFGLGLAAAGHEPDISRRLFSRSFEQLAEESLRLGVDDPLDQWAAVPVIWETAQDRRRLEAGPTHRMGIAWSIEATWDGALGIYSVQGSATPVSTSSWRTGCALRGRQPRRCWVVLLLAARVT